MSLHPLKPINAMFRQQLFPLQCPLLLLLLFWCQCHMPTTTMALAGESSRNNGTTTTTQMPMPMRMQWILLKYEMPEELVAAMLPASSGIDRIQFSICACAQATTAPEASGNKCQCGSTRLDTGAGESSSGSTTKWWKKAAFPNSCLIRPDPASDKCRIVPIKLTNDVQQLPEGKPSIVYIRVAAQKYKKEGEEGNGTNANGRNGAQNNNSLHLLTQPEYQQLELEERKSFAQLSTELKGKFISIAYSIQVQNDVPLVPMPTSNVASNASSTTATAMEMPTAINAENKVMATTTTNEEKQRKNGQLVPPVWHHHNKKHGTTKMGVSKIATRAKDDGKKPGNNNSKRIMDGQQQMVRMSVAGIGAIRHRRPLDKQTMSAQVPMPSKMAPPPLLPPAPGPELLCQLLAQMGTDDEQIRRFLLVDGLRQQIHPRQFDVERFKRAVVRIHNRYRRQHGSTELAQSAECERAAKRWADQSVARVGCATTTHEAQKRYGESLFFYVSSGPYLTDPDTMAEATVRTFYVEAADYWRSARWDQQRHGHYTQLLWRDTSNIGIGVSIQPTWGGSGGGCIPVLGGDGWLFYVVLRYDPKGNIWLDPDQFQQAVPRGKELFIGGKECSSSKAAGRH